MPTILPCPFCGKQPEIREHLSEEIWAMVCCKNRHCAAQPLVVDSPKIDAYKTTKEAVSAAIRRWNRRK